MIQVLQRAIGVLELLAEQEPMTLKELTEATGIKKPTLCLILKSLVELGCAEKAGNGIYVTGSKLQELAALPRKRSTVVFQGWGLNPHSGLLSLSSKTKIMTPRPSRSC